mmetsp:Transcript_8926/g.19622  ORF Transcript_8926/g.19622 Transcript_8926/m.19622 type:complete len:328 (-) Transcript_8926:167-1150(-)
MLLLDSESSLNTRDSSSLLPSCSCSCASDIARCLSRTAWWPTSLRKSTASISAPTRIFSKVDRRRLEPPPHASSWVLSARSKSSSFSRVLKEVGGRWSRSGPSPTLHPLLGEVSSGSRSRWRAELEAELEPDPEGKVLPLGGDSPMADRDTPVCTDIWSQDSPCRGWLHGSSSYAPPFSAPFPTFAFTSALLDSSQSRSDVSDSTNTPWPRPWRVGARICVGSVGRSSPEIALRLRLRLRVTNRPPPGAPGVLEEGEDALRVRFFWDSSRPESSSPLFPSSSSSSRSSSRPPAAPESSKYPPPPSCCVCCDPSLGLYMCRQSPICIT